MKKSLQNSKNAISIKQALTQIYKLPSSSAPYIFNSFNFRQLISPSRSRRHGSRCSHCRRHSFFRTFYLSRYFSLPALPSGKSPALLSSFPYFLPLFTLSLMKSPCYMLPGLRLRHPFHLKRITAFGRPHQQIKESKNNDTCHDHTKPKASCENKGSDLIYAQRHGIS